MAVKIPDIEERIWTAAEAGEDVVKRCIEKLKRTDIFPDDKQFMERLAFIMSRNGEGTFRTDGGIWQISRFAFEDTQNDRAHIRLARKYKRLEQAFGIKNWKDVKRHDLEVPMYSAIAARLYLSNFPEPIPPAYDIDKQQDYWWRIYMQNHESKWLIKEEDFKLCLKKASTVVVPQAGQSLPPKCSEPPATSSPTNFPSSQQQSFVKNKKRIENCVLQPEYCRAQGIMIAVGMFGAPGTVKDIQNVQSTFEWLDFAFLSVQDPTSEELHSLIKAAAEYVYPVQYNYIAFYFAGHGGEDKSGLFVKTLEMDKSKPILHIEPYIIEPLKEVKLTRLFFFDCCQTPGEGSAYRGDGPITKKPKDRPGQVIAYATSKGQKSVGDKDAGGLWTYHLCKNLRNQDLIVTVLAKTNDNVCAERKDMQQPTTISNVGVLAIKKRQ